MSCGVNGGRSAVPCSAVAVMAHPPGDDSCLHIPIIRQRQCRASYDAVMSSVVPLRPGPADPESAQRIRERILDAATQCLLDEGLDARLHAMIAERAGISRPTVYKYI